MVAVPKPEKKKKEKKKKLKSIKTLYAKAKKVFNKFIRDRDAVELQGKCCTCGKPGNQAGHFVKSTHKKLEFHTKNVHLQCTHCNCYLDGNEAEYSKFIIEKYSIEYFHWLLSQKGTWKQTVPERREYLEYIIAAYE